MLKKLLKYDLIWVYKIVIVFYMLAIFFALTYRGINIFASESTVADILASFINGVAVAMIINIIINTVIRCWVRFKTNMYGDEAYLTHTLPIERRTVFLSKILSASIAIFTSVLVCLLALFIMYYSKDNMEALKQMVIGAANLYNISTIGLIIIMTITFFLELLFAILAGYMGLVIGYRCNNNKFPMSLVSGFSLYVLAQTLLIGIIFFIGLFDKDIMLLFTSKNNIDINSLKNILYICIGIYAMYTVLCYYIGNKLFKNGVNVE